MKTTKISVLILSFFLALFSISAIADVSVKSYYKNDGTYVQPHQRSNPNGNINDNWSTKGNKNPYTGKEGTKSPDSYQDNK